MAKDPSMPFYVNDWLSSPTVSCMTLEQQAAYLRLLCFCWASGVAGITSDDQVLSKLSGMGEGWFNGGSQMVRSCFVKHPNHPSLITNTKLLGLWAERQEWRRKSIEGGRRSGQSRRKSTPPHELLNEPPFNHPSNQMRTKDEPKANSSSSSSSSFPSSFENTNTTPLIPQGGSDDGNNPEIPVSSNGRKTRKPSTPKAVYEVERQVYPPSLDTEEFRACWQMWTLHRIEIKYPLTLLAAEQSLAKCAAWGVDRAVAAIRESVAQQWRGLFEPKENGKPKLDPNRASSWG